MGATPINIKLRCGSWQQLASIYKRDLPRGAIFLRSGNPPPVGTEVNIDLTLPSDSTIQLSGTISRHIGEADAEGRGPGVDVRINTIPQSAMWLIETALASANQRDPSKESPLPGAAASGPVAAGGPAERPPSLADGAEVSEAERELTGALTAELAALRRLNPFQVLGLGYEAGDAEIRAAFGELTKRYHPDRYTRFASIELRQLAAEIFILIRDAYRRIGDPAARAQALGQLGGSGPTRATAAMAIPVPVERSGGTAALPAAPRPKIAVPPRPPTVRAATPAAVAIPPVVAIPPSGPAGSAAPAAPASAASSGAMPAAVDRGITAPTLQTPGQPPSVAVESTSLTERKLDGRSTGSTVPPPQAAPPSEHASAESLLETGKLDDAAGVYRGILRRSPQDARARAGLELIEGLRAMAARDRMEAAQRFEAVLELDPANERAARELAEMRRLATNERKGMLSRLLTKKD
jgi:hypothetical protein